VEIATGFDIFARKNHRHIDVRVKTCAPGAIKVLFQNEFIDQKVEDLAEGDFTIIVRMGEIRERDDFFIIATRILLTQLQTWTKRGVNVQIGGYWEPHRKVVGRLNFNCAERWMAHRDDWPALEVQTQPACALGDKEGSMTLSPNT
jgi:hypothetical protein